MYQQTPIIGIPDKLVIALMTVVLFVAGLFASLLALASGGAIALFVLGKAWWLNRRAKAQCIEGEYQVLPE